MSSRIPISTRERLHAQPQPPCEWCGHAAEPVYLQGVRCPNPPCPLYRKMMTHAKWNETRKVAA